MICYLLITMRSITSRTKYLLLKVTYTLDLNSKNELIRSYIKS